MKFHRLLSAACSLMILVGCTPSTGSSLEVSNASEPTSTYSSDDTSAITTSTEPSSERLPPLVLFNVTLPGEIDATSQIKIAGTFNGWNPLAEGYALTGVGPLTYQISLDFPLVDVGKSIQYKYVLLKANQEESAWNYVEGTATGGETSNRNYVLKAGKQIVNDTILSFKNNSSLSTVTRGTLQKVTLSMPQFGDGRTRTIRIWLPDGYTPEDTAKRYPVMYMHDGQNLFDQYTGFAGEWQIDESIGTMMDGGYDGSIVVGIDNSNDRLNELSPTWPLTTEGSGYIDNPSGEKYAAFIIDTVKPYIDSHFNTNPSRATTGIGGSSMGGVESFYMALSYTHVFGYGLLFSTALWLYQSTTIHDFIAGLSLNEPSLLPRLYIYAGGLEGSVTPYVEQIRTSLLAHNYPETKINTLVDPSKDHNEAAWATHFPAAYRWLVEA